jgi:enamine deaminase RidA (YjgF/YER057c/UK114 family)
MARDASVRSALAAEAQGSKAFLTLKPLAGESVREIFGRLAKALSDLELETAHLMVFGPVRARDAGMGAMQQHSGGVEWPITWIEADACDGAPIAGIQAFAVARSKVHRIRLGGQVIGSVFEDGSAKHCLLGGLAPEQGSLSRAEQTRRTLDLLEKALAQGGFALADIVRTWFFLDDILAWYGEFNRVRTQTYLGVRFRSGSVPASTGVGARNTAGAALTLAAWAMQPSRPDTRVQEIASPLQCPASTYGNAFCRAIEIASASGTNLLVSGTASIASNGETLWEGNVQQQVERTMQVVEAILHSRDCTFSDLTRAVAYFRRSADVRAFTDWCAKHHVLSLPVITARCDICRDDLLFELEADAWKPGEARCTPLP